MVAVTSKAAYTVFMGAKESIWLQIALDLEHTRGLQWAVTDWVVWLSCLHSFKPLSLI